MVFKSYLGSTEKLKLNFKICLEIDSILSSRDLETVDTPCDIFAPEHLRTWFLYCSFCVKYYSTVWPREHRTNPCCVTVKEFLAHDAFIRTNRRAPAMMSVRPSVCLSGAGVHCDHTVHVSADLSLWLDSPMFWAPSQQSMSTYSSRLFPAPPGREVQTRRRDLKNV